MSGINCIRLKLIVFVIFTFQKQNPFFATEYGVST